MVYGETKLSSVFDLAATGQCFSSFSTEAPSDNVHVALQAAHEHGGGGSAASRCAPSLPLPRPRVRHSRYQHPPSLVPGQEIQIRTRYTPPGHPAALPRLHADCRAPGTLRPDHVASLHHSRQRDTGREVATEVCV